MKKFLCMLLALLMLMLPVGLAETAETTEATEAGELAEKLTEATIDAAGSTFAGKYTAQGQRLVTDASFRLGEGLQAMLPEDAKAPVTDLLNALKIETVAQSTEGKNQGALRLILNDVNAADITLAADDGGIYAASSFLGSKVFQVTPDQLKELLKLAADQMVAEGVLTQEQLDSLLNGLKALQEDPEGVLAGLIGNPDPSGLLAAVQELISQEPTFAAVTELPPEVKFEAKSVITLTVKKDALKNVTTELGKFLWSMPGVQKLAGFIKVNGEALTEESLISGLSALPDALTEDMVIRIYMAENAPQPMQIIADLKFTDGEKTVPLTWSIYIGGEEGQATLISINASVEMDGDRADMSYDISVEGDENKGSVNAVVSMKMTENGVETEPVHEEISTNWERQEAAVNMNAEMKVTVVPDNETAPVTVLFNIAGEEKDLGDHAEGAATLNIAVDGMGDMLTMTVERKTDLAEAYIITADAVQPMAMSAEEQEALMSEVSQSAMMGLVKLLQSLPESVQPLVQQMLGGGM